MQIPQHRCVICGDKMKIPMDSLTIAAALMAASVTYAVCGMAQEVRSGANIVTPNEIKWAVSQRGENAVLLGNPNKAERYVTRVKFPVNTIIPPHQHPEDEEITVSSGTWYLGLGATMEPEKAIALPPGSFVFIPAKTWHFVLTKSDSVEVDFRGTGPRVNIFAK
jgi:quercetin dioxygenase-like cupin family protein